MSKQKKKKKTRKNHIESVKNVKVNFKEGSTVHVISKWKMAFYKSRYICIFENFTRFLKLTFFTFFSVQNYVIFLS